MKKWCTLIPMVALVACSTEQPSDIESQSTKKEVVTESDLATKAATHIKSQLKMTAVDPLDTAWFAQDITGDQVKDYIITVNLMDRAINEAVEKDKLNKAKEMGFMGYYNFFFWVDGATEEISDAIVVASSPSYKLDVHFKEILGTGQTDFYVDYRVRNMQRRKFFAIYKGKTKEICQAVIFDGLGTSETVAYDVRIEDGTINDYNDIVEYEAQLEDVIIPNMDSTYAYNPKITSTNKEVRRWHFSPTYGKYYLIQE